LLQLASLLAAVTLENIARKATTFRLNPEVQAALAVLSDVLGRPQNQLVNEAVRVWVAKRIAEVDVGLVSTVTRLRAHRLTDTTGQESMAAAMAAEAAVEDDPAKGVRGERTPTGPASARMLERLRG
jgi:predicted DNA-binding protein